MSLSPGTRLGPYEILAPIGAGGMGEVYRARDTRLERNVAIKVLPSHLPSSPEIRQRFEREARTISQLSHPHICALYDVGREGETEYLVMELLEGETLSDRLVKGALPLEQTLRYGVEIADALDKAHRQGIVHRDLKPGNVMLTKSGVKLLDFGLAKAMSPATQPSSLTALPTQQGLTQEGTILGTFQYMAPEQLEGKEADARTDIFAFGAVLYEMATGKKAFSGTTQASLIGAILHTEPASISSIQPMTPPALDRMVKTCLAKDPEDRWQSAGDLKRELGWIAEGGSRAGLPAPVTARRKSRERLGWILFAAAAFGLVALGAFFRASRREPPRMLQASLLPPEKAAFAFDAGPMVLSPDGRRIAFVAASPGAEKVLWVWPLDSSAAQPLAGTEGGSYPFWSPDSRFLGFFAGGKLKKINASGGPPQAICDASNGRGGTWNREGVILFAPSVRDPIHRVSSSGGKATPLVALDPSRQEFSQKWPHFLPDGQHFLYLSQTAAPETSENSAVFVGDLDSKSRKLLLGATNSNAAYAPAGYLLFCRGRALLAQALDAKKLELAGEAFPVAEQVQYFSNAGMAVFSVSENGLLAFQAGGAVSNSLLTWFDRTGKKLETVGAPADYGRPRLSHDGRRVAVDVADPQSGNWDVWIHDLSRRTATRFTFGPAGNHTPVWSPDDSRILFTSSRKGIGDIYQKATIGNAPEEPLVSSPVFKVPVHWREDGRFFSIQFNTFDPKVRTNSDIWTFSVQDRKAAPFLQSEFNERLPVFSPDGRFLTYQSDETGREEIYVQAFPGPGGKWQISTGGGSQPVWRRDGKELFYVASGKVMAVPVQTSPAFEAGDAEPLFDVRMRDVPGRRYDVSADGQRFLVNAPTAEEGVTPVTLVVNWAAGLKP